MTVTIKKTKNPPRSAICCFWNNKGGTGKTSLVFQSLCRYAEQRPEERILAIDMCPQANLSELLLGGLTNKGSDNLLKFQGAIPRSTIGGYFQLRLPSPYTPPQFNSDDFIVNPAGSNSSVPSNVDLVCGDPLLELQVNAMSTLSNAQIPGTNTWLAVMDWLRDFLAPIRSRYTMIFIDANPSFSVYTQMALAAADELVLPVMADDSSRRAVQNVFSLVYGLKVPSEIYTQHAFGTRLTAAGRPLPKIRLIVKNRLTQYMGPASAYADVLSSIEKNVMELHQNQPALFVPTTQNKLFADVRDFQTTGVVAFAKGAPFTKLQAGRVALVGQRVRVNEEYRKHCIGAIDDLVANL
ncbi:ParA family protein [Archangium violaceum]|uniref:ParA family protein n=1 Tax=Archangium violaceum TaxID=83451 RepID=UPI00193C2061|nr:ParA family protein [Archangium violaceum]QRK06065.1 ParA family protein [Archangium violaceum]QRK08062.1 ParA family protein [Archangium violaceum]